MVDVPDHFDPGEFEALLDVMWLPGEVSIEEVFDVDGWVFYALKRWWAWQEAADADAVDLPLVFYP